MLEWMRCALTETIIFHGRVNDYMNIVLTKFLAKTSATAAVANRTVKCDNPHPILPPKP